MNRLWSETEDVVRATYFLKQDLTDHVQRAWRAWPLLLDVRLERECTQRETSLVLTLVLQDIEERFEVVRSLGEMEVLILHGDLRSRLRDALRNAAADVEHIMWHVPLIYSLEN